MLEETVKFKIDVLYNCNGEAQGVDEATQLQYINRLRVSLPPFFAGIVDEYGGSYGRVHWATLEEDMIEFSRLYPNMIFAVYYDGCEVDMGVQYFHRGRFYFAEAQIVFPKFDLNALPPLPPRIQVVVYDGNLAAVLGLPPIYDVESIALDSDHTDEFYMCRQDDKAVVLCSYHVGERLTGQERPITEIVYGPFTFGPCQLCPH